MLGTTNTEFSFIEVWFTDKNSEPLEIEDNVNLTLIIEIDIQYNQNLEDTLKDTAFYQEKLVINMVKN